MPGSPGGAGEVVVELGQHFRHARAIPFDLTGAGRQLFAGRGLYLGHAVIEPTGLAAGEVDVYDGSDTTGMLVAPISLTAGQSTRDWWGPQGIIMAGGLYANVSVGRVRGTLFFLPDLYG